jgi:prepilin-type N-terminal cleavage/methylation domain-containing protein
MKILNIMKKNIIKGFSLVELLITLLVFSMASVIITQILVFNIRSTRSYSDYTTQQFTLQDAYRRLNRDINAATQIEYSPGNTKTITLTIDGEDVTWTLDSGRLILNGTTITDQLTSNSKFEVTTDYLVVTLEAKPTTADGYAVNIAKPIVAQYSRYSKNIVFLISPP